MTQNMIIKGREFTVEGPSPRFGTYVLTGPRGATFAALPFANDTTAYIVVGGRNWDRELRIHGNRVLLRRTETGELREFGRAPWEVA